MLEIGDVIVHLRHGAGKVIGTRTFTRNGTERHYYSIEIAGDAGMLYIPQDSVDDSRLRYALDDTSLIKTVMENDPQELADNHQVRRTNIEKKIKSSNPRDVIQALRDLTWRERTDKLTGTDKNLRDNALERLVNELTLSTSMTVEKVHTRINHIIDEAMSNHLSHQSS